MRSIVLALVVLSMLTACAGRAANPVMVRQFGDEQRSCEALGREMAFIQEEIHRLVPQTEKTGKNVALGVTGFFLLVPLFFMDLSKAEQIEVDAYRQRYNHLMIVAMDKECGIEAEEIQPFN